MKLQLALLGHDFRYKIEHTIRLFFHDISFLPLEDEKQDFISTELTNSEAVVTVCLNQIVKSKTKEISSTVTQKEKERCLCTLLFELLVEQTGIKPPWGILTGVRPVKLYHMLAETGQADEEIQKVYQERYLANEHKTKLAAETARVQQPLLKKITPDTFSLYVSIPFCPTRCTYCSFVSHAIQNTEKLVPEYVDFLCQELIHTAQVVKETGLKLQTVYIGGGTPTTLSPKQLGKILQTIEQHFSFQWLEEYTVEAGRPDTITREKLQTIQSHGIQRISINPQTLNEKVLQNIGRRHSVDEFFEALNLAKSMNFGVINTDFIAGLPGETAESFLHGIQRIVDYVPENITVHTLTVKRSSTLKEQSVEFVGEALHLENLLETTQNMLFQKGYRPYYLYRQKGTRQNQENVGYSLPGTESLYNIAMMEEVQTVLGVGAGAATKIVRPQEKIQRIFNFKYPYEYNQQFKEILIRKDKVRDFYA